MASPKPGTPEWQEQLNRQIAEHDKQARESGNEGQQFEISGGSK